MALGNNSNRIFLGVADGKITQSANAETQGAVLHTSKEGKVSYRLLHDFVEGILTNIVVRENEFNGQKIKSWVLTLSDMGQVYQLELSLKGGYGSSLIKCLANPAIDFTRPIKFTPWAKTVNEKKKTAMYISQADKQIEWFFTKDNPNGLPEPKKVMFQGAEQWDWFDQLQFLEKYVETVIKPKLAENKPAAQNDGPAYAKPADISSAPEDDDLPF